MKSMKELLRKYSIFYDEEELKDDIAIKTFDDNSKDILHIYFYRIYPDYISFKFNSFKYSYMAQYLCINIDNNTNKPVEFIVFTESNSYGGAAFKLEDQHLPLNIRRYELDGKIGIQLVTSFNGSYAEEDIL